MSIRCWLGAHDWATYWVDPMTGVAMTVPFDMIGTTYAHAPAFQPVAYVCWRCAKQRPLNPVPSEPHL